MTSPNRSMTRQQRAKYFRGRQRPKLPQRPPPVDDDPTIADQILEGVLCENCGAWAEKNQNGEPTGRGCGHPRQCRSCRRRRAGR